MIERYTLPRMGAIWTQQQKYETWLAVELAVCEALEANGTVPKGIAAYVRRKVKINTSRIAEIEHTTKHDVIAFLESLEEQVGSRARYLHAGLTSSDILDTSLAVQLVKSVKIILEDLDALLTLLQDIAFEQKDTIMVGRSHGIHGEPISLGFKFALWYQEFSRQRKRLLISGEDVAIGKLSGAMGTFAHFPIKIENIVCAKLGLKPAAVSNQIIQRDRHAAFLTTLALIAASIEKVSTEIRHLQRTEVGEVEESFGVGQKGSSAMPHKRNPIVSENLCGLARVIRSNSIAALENVALWHERDISHSSVERIIIPDSVILTDYMLVRLTQLLKDLVVYPKRMVNNLNITGGLIFSQRLLIALVNYGCNRKMAYEAVQRNAMKTGQGDGNFQDLVEKDPFINQKLSKSEIKACFRPEAYLKNLNHIYRRVFGATSKKKTNPTKGRKRN